MTAGIDREALLDRRIPLAGTFNLREVRDYEGLDGRTVRPGLLYRSDALHQLTDEGRADLRERGIHTVLDLRERGERDVEPDRLDGVGATIVSYPLLDAGVGDRQRRSAAVELAALYTWIIDNRGAKLAGAIRELARPGALPAVVHCTAGKDRTGIVIALLLSALGVDDGTVVADFAVTELNLGDEFRRLFLERAVARGADPVALASALGSDPSLAHQVLTRVSGSDGSAAAYLLRHGLLEAELSSLRELLLSPTATTQEGDAS